MMSEVRFTPLEALPDYVAAKVKRAEHHLQDLEALLFKWPDTVQVRVEAVFDPLLGETGAWGARLHIDGDLPEDVPLIVGDFLHNLRASLDYLARALVLTSGGVPVDGVGGTTFPILKEDKKDKPLTVKGLKSPEIRLAIEAVQPYKYPECTQSWHALRILHELSNADKHRELHIPLVAVAEPATMLIGHLPEEPVGLIQTTGRSFSNGDWLIQAFAPFPQDVPVDVISTTLVVAGLEDAYKFPDGSVVSLVNQLDFMLRYVRDEVIPGFREYFLEPWPEDVFTSQEVVGPLATEPKTPEQQLSAVEFLKGFFADHYGAARCLVLGPEPGAIAGPNFNS
jgi:hypothetical protein